MNWGGTALACSGWMLILAGCNGGSATLSASDEQATAVLKIVGAEYGSYLAGNNGQPPKDAEAFRRFLESRLDELAAYNVEDVNDLLNSPRDGEPLVIVTGKKLSPPDQPGTPWAAYEQTGVDGKRMAVNVRGGVVELAPEQFAQYVTQ